MDQVLAQAELLLVPNANLTLRRLPEGLQDEVALPFGSLIPALRFDRFEMEPLVDDVYAAANPGRTPVGLTDSAWSPKLGALVPLGAGITLLTGRGVLFSATRQLLLGRGAAALTLSPAVQAQTTPAEAAAAPMQTVTLVGSRRATSSATDTVVPVDIIPMNKVSEQGGQFDLAQVFFG